MKERWLLLIICIFPLSLGAISQKTVEKWFNAMNSVIHTDSAEFSNSNLGVHFLGGGGMVRSRIYDSNPIHVQLPTFSAGCGGIDYTLGAINIASKDEMVRALKSIMSNAASYAFLLGLEVISPMIVQTTSEIQAWANTFNAININSCEIGASLMQGLWPQIESSDKYICNNIATNFSLAKDLIEARHRCHDDKSFRNQTTKKATKGSDLIAGDYNIAYSVLKKFTEMDGETQQLCLNLTGTIVSLKDEITVFPSKGMKVFEIIEMGGAINDGYKFSNAKGNFAGIDLEDVKINPQHSWHHRVLSILRSLSHKIVEERHSKCTLTSQERELLSKTTFPIGSLTSLMAQWGGEGAALTSLTECAEIISMERISAFLKEMLTNVLMQAESVKHAQIDPSTIDEYINNLQTIKKEIDSKQMYNYQRMSAKNEQIRFLIDIDRAQRDQARGEF